MTERGILFNGDMVRAILGGRKTVTRRVLKTQPTLKDGFWQLGGAGWSARINSITPVAGHSLAGRCPYGKPGDRLWVRETWAPGATQVMYRAECNPSYRPPDGKWKPSIHMPRWASRILLEVTAVHVQRLQDITEEQAQAEGVMHDEDRPEEHDWRNNGKLCPKCAGTGLHNGIGSGGGVIFDIDCRECDTALKRFKHLWNSTGGDWDANPWVWVIEFKRIEP